MFRALPTAIGYAQLGSDAAEAVVTPLALAVVVGDDAQSTLDDFFRAFVACRDRYRDASDDDVVRLGSGELGEWGFDQLRIRRTLVLLRGETLLSGGPGAWEKDDGEHYGWEQVVLDRINRYREVATLDDYLVERRAEIAEMSRTSPFVTHEGMPIATAFPVSLAGAAPELSTHAEPPHREVFVIHGRDAEAKRAMFDYLRALDLVPMEWEQIVSRTKKGAPYISEILDAAFSEAQAVVVLMTPDDHARLDPAYLTESDREWEREMTPQARPNVLFEAGMAFGRNPDRTIIVELGSLRPFSDVGGRHTLHMDDSPAQRNALKGRLRTAGCPIRDDTDAWLMSTPFPKR